MIQIMFYGSVPGVQNAYRAEATALLHALIYTNGNCVMIMDCKAVIRQYQKGPRANLKHDGLLWQAIFIAYRNRKARGGGSIKVVWTSSHKKAEYAAKREVPMQYWFANQVAYALAGRAAGEASLPQHSIDLTLAQERWAHAILRRLVCIAKYIAPHASTHKRNMATGRGSGKLECLESLAKASGHSLTPLFKCTKCFIQLDLSLNRTYLESILEMPCVGSLVDPIVRHSRVEDDAILVLNRTEAHSSYALATSPALQLHFCAACGCYSAERSKGLKLVCKRFPTKAGKEALAAIHTGNRPSKSCMDMYKRIGKNNLQKKYRISSEKAPSPVGSQPVAASAAAAADVAPPVAIVPRARSRSRERILKREGKPIHATISLHDSLTLVGLNANSQKQPGGNNPGSAKNSPLEPALGISPGSASSSNSEVIVKVGGASRDAEVVPPPPPVLACARHRRGGWSILDPCEACIIAMALALSSEGGPESSPTA